jgi:hypothetical protein
MLRAWHAFWSIESRALSSFVHHTLRSQEKCLRRYVGIVERSELAPFQEINRL